jgi:hypothetical protein
MCNSFKDAFLGPIGLSQPKSPKVKDAPPAPPAPKDPPKAPAMEDVPRGPDPNSREAQQAAADVQTEALERRKRSTFLTGPGGISKESFGNPDDIKKADLFGGGGYRA